MARATPVLAFVAGPQQDLRVSIPGNSALMGRSPQADITIEDQHASREQLQFELTTDGWTVRNLSSFGTRINGKKYKKPQKRILLETGDVLEIGDETKILFVAPGDGVEEAVDKYLAEHAPPPPEKGEAQKEQQQPPTPQKPPATEKPSPPPDRTDTLDEDVEQLNEEEKRKKDEKKKKLKRYLVIFGVYMGVVIIVIAILAQLGDTGKIQTNAPPALEDNRIRSILQEPIEGKHRNPVKAQEAIKKARMLYQDRNVEQEPDNLYRSVKYFKLYLAYTHRSDFQEISDQWAYNRAETQLITRVIDQYRKAYKLEQNHQWQDAKREFEKLLKMIPATSEPEPENDNQLWKNAINHLNYVKEQLPKKRRYF